MLAAYEHSQGTSDNTIPVKWMTVTAVQNTDSFESIYRKLKFSVNELIVNSI